MKRDERHQELVGVDAVKHIREAQRQIAEAHRQGLRQREVDGPVREQKLTVDTMVFKVGGRWKMETIKEALDGLGTVTVYEEDERLLVAEMRWALASQLLNNRVVGKPEDARHIASNAVILIHGRVL
jgi:hypothetical protein